MEKMSDCVKIAKVACQSESKNGPILVQFEHGNVDPDSFSSFKAKNVAFKSVAGHVRVEADIKAKKMHYTTTSSSLKGYRATPYQKTFLALRNKKGQTLDLYEVNPIVVGADVAAPFTKNQLLVQAKLEADERKKLEQQNQPVTAADKAAMKKHLVTEFGQAKGKRIYAQADRMQVDEEARQEKLSKVMLNFSDDPMLLPDDDDDVQLDLPIHREEKRIEDVYKLADFLTDSELDALQEAARAKAVEFDSLDKIEAGLNSRSMSVLLATSLGKQVGAFDDQKLAVAVYIEAIVAFVNLRPRGFDMGPKALPDFIPDTIRRKVFNLFTEERRVTPKTKDTAICFIIALSLMINNYYLDMSCVTKSIPRTVNNQHLKQLVQIVGATINSDSLTKKAYIVLKFPLAVYKSKKKFKRNVRRTK